MPINKGLHAYTPKNEIHIYYAEKVIMQPAFRSAFQGTPQTQPVPFRTENTQALHKAHSKSINLLLGNAVFGFSVKLNNHKSHLRV